jgi:hypothetical protein
MNRYEWLQKETALIPRKKFFVFEPLPVSCLNEVEAQYGNLPPDYVEFIQKFGRARLFQSTYNTGHKLLVLPPHVQVQTPTENRRKAGDVVRINLGYYTNSGDVWLEWSQGALLYHGAVFVGLTVDRRKAAASFEEWLKISFLACRKLYSKTEWDGIMKPVPPFDEREQAVVAAMPNFSFRKVEVTPARNVRVEIKNNSQLELPHFTVGVRAKNGMEGAVALRTGGILPGMTRIIEEDLYRGCMDPHSVELFRLPVPDPEDRPYYAEFRDRL